MKWNPYQDQENRAYSGILTILFPEQTKTIPRILVWSLIFLADLILVAVGAYRFDLLGSGSHTLLLLAALLGIFWIQGQIWQTFLKFFR